MVDGKWVERKPATRIHRGKVETTVHSVFRETLACFRRPVIALFFAPTYGTCFSLVRPSPRSRPIFSREPCKSQDETPLVVDFDYGRRALRRSESIIPGTFWYTDIYGDAPTVVLPKFAPKITQPRHSCYCTRRYLRLGVT